MKQLLILFCVLCSPLFALTGREVMEKVHIESQKKSTRQAVVDMKIYDDQGRSRVRYFNYWTKFTDNSEKSLIKFFRPKNIKGTALLTRSKTVSDIKSQWIYLPAFKSVKQLSSSDKNKSFMGSDFSYSDIAGRKLDQDTHVLVRESDDYFFVESIPVDSESASYSKIRYIVSKYHNLVAKAIFYDLKGEKLKTLHNKKISLINNVNVVMTSEMTNHQTKGKTILIVQSMKVGSPINDNLLTVTSLKTL